VSAFPQLKEYGRNRARLKTSTSVNWIAQREGPSMAVTRSQRQPDPPLVGRERERAVLRDALASALAGEPRVVLLAGEPGIGKTRLAEDLAGEAAARGARVYWGHCFEWAGTPAYWPWIEVLRELAETTDPEHLSKHLGQGAPFIARIVPEIAARLPDLPTVPEMNPEQARFRLFDAVRRYLVEAADEHPLVIILEDLHWADPATLLLLEFVAREVSEARLLIVGTYRDVEVRRDHPLASTLAALARVRGVERLALSGLDHEHVADIARQLTGIVPPERVVGAVYERTEGNPFFVTEVVRLLAQQNLFVSPAQQANWNWHVTMPESVREVIGRGLDRLSKKCNDLLLVASVIGREFSLPVLRRVSDLSIDALLEVLDEAVAARVIEEWRGVGTFRFSHALIQETLYEELSASRRYRLHGRVGEALEREHASNRAPHFGDLARHFGLSPFHANLGKAIEYATRAGDQAMAQVAWESAAGHYQRAVELLEAYGDSDARQVCEMLLKLGEAQGRAGVSRGRSLGAGIDPVSRDTFMRAMRIAHAANLPEHQAKAALGAIGGNPWASQGTEDFRLLNEALRHLPEEDSDIRARLLARLSRVAFIHVIFYGLDEIDGISLVQSSTRWGDEAVGIARRLGGPATIAYALVMRPMTFSGAVEEFDDHLKSIQEALDAATRANDHLVMLWGLAVKYNLLLQRGDLESARQVSEILPSIGEPFKSPLVDWLMTLLPIGTAMCAGRYNEADYLIERADRIWPNSFVTSFQRLVVQRERGQPFGAVGEFVESGNIPRMIKFPFALVSVLETGNLDEVRSRLQGAELRTFLTLPRTPTWLRGMTLIAEVCAELRGGPASLIYEALTPFGYHNISSEGYDDKSGGCVSYYLGLLAMTLERWDEAEQHFTVSLDLNRQWGYRPYVAYTRYAWADMLLRRGEPSDRERAREALTDAKATAEEIGTVRLLRLIGELEHRTGLHAGPRSSGLSPRELDVLRLLVEGKSDREIAQDLYISHHTVMRHVSSILRKLDVDSRAAAAVYAVRHDLV
jgi:DNA-binding CsgD family transcriptional regulator